MTLAAPVAADAALCIDFECRSALDLRTRNAHVWCQHPSFELLCCAYILPFTSTIRMWQRGEPVPTAIVAHITAGKRVRGWNVMFEYECTQTAEARRAGWPALSITQLDDSMARAAAAGLPQSLEECGCVLGLTTVKDVKGHVNMRAIVHPRQSQQPVEPERWEKLLTYCLADVAAEMAIAAALPPLSEPEAALWGVNALINQRGIPIDLPLVELAHASTQATAAAMDAEMCAVTAGAVPAASNVSRLKAFLGAKGVEGFELLDLNAPKEDDDEPPPEVTLQKHDLARLLDDPGLDPVARRALEIRQASGKAATKKFAAMLNRTAPDGRLRGEYVYCGAAATGRFASRGLQMHNLKRTPKAFRFEPIEEALRAGRPVSLDDLGLSVRSMIAAPPGRVIAKGDYGQVEYRGVCWLAGETERLEALARNELPYELTAARIRGIPIEEVTTDLRNSLGKPVVLGSGYQLGPVGLANLMERQGRAIDEAEAQRAIMVFREAHPNVVALWRAAERAAMTAMEDRFAGCWVPFGADKRLAFVHQTPWLLLRLPSGRCIRYFEPKIELREKFGRMMPALTVIRRSKFTHQYRREALYGGLLVENATQGMCRDILATAMMRLEASGLGTLIGHTHDEAILLCDAAVNRAAEIEALMTRPISWLPDFPLSVEVKAAFRYG